MRRVVVTGMGAVTPIGIGVENFWNSVKEKRTGLCSGGCSGSNEECGH